MFWLFCFIMGELKGYELSRNWFNFCFDNPEKIKPIHTAIYFFAVEHCNRLGWKSKFGFPSQMAMEALGIKNWRTYIKAFNDLIEFGFIKLIEKSSNQYSSNIIAIVKNTKAQSKALDKALQKHSTKQGQSTVSINKQRTINKEQLTKNMSCNKDYKKSLLIDLKESDFNDPDYFEITMAFFDLFRNNLDELGIKTTIIDKAKGTWIDQIRLMLENKEATREDLKTIFQFLKKDEFWKKNIQSTSNLRKHATRLLIQSKQNGKLQRNSKEGTTIEELIEITKKNFGP